MPVLDITASQANSHNNNMNVNGHGNWLSNDPRNPTPASPTTSPPSPGVQSRPRPDLDNGPTIPGGITASLAFYKASLSSRLKQINNGHHTAFIYTTLQDPTPFIYHGPPFVTKTKGFKQTHADFHSMVSAKDLGTYAFCGVCGAILKHEMRMREGVVEELETHQIGIKPVTTKLEDDDNVSVDSESAEFREKESER